MGVFVSPSVCLWNFNANYGLDHLKVRLKIL